MRAATRQKGQKFLRSSFKLISYLAQFSLIAVIFHLSSTTSYYYLFCFYQIEYFSLHILCPYSKYSLFDTK
jgi:hypothetical protein